MSLWNSNVMFLFLEVTDVPRARFFMEDVLGLELIENRFHPPHERHGIAKYDAGNSIIALNLAVKTFERQAADGIVTVFGTDPMSEAKVYARLHTAGLSPPQTRGGVFGDHDNHRFELRCVKRSSTAGGDHRVLGIEMLRFAVDDLKTSSAFYHEVLGLPLVREDGNQTVLGCANVQFVLQGQAKGDLPVRNDGFLTVFYTPRIEEVYDSLVQRGLDFRNLKVRYSDIGGAVRFCDPSGHAFCLYEPSAECLSWESGPKVRALMNEVGDRSEVAIH